MKPIMFLDIDGVLWDIHKGAPMIVVDPRLWYKGANGLQEFMEFALENFEVRWLSTWTIGTGKMAHDGLATLERWTGVPTEVWRQVNDGPGHFDYKTERLPWEELSERGFVWVEDGLLKKEMDDLRSHGFGDSYIHADVFEDSDALIHAMEAIQEWLHARYCSIEG